MWPDQVSNPGPLTYDSGALPTALRGPAISLCISCLFYVSFCITNNENMKNKKNLRLFLLCICFNICRAAQRSR